jgi:hypothetical protein
LLRDDRIPVKRSATCAAINAKIVSAHLDVKEKTVTQEFFPYGGDGTMDDVALLLNGLGKRCAGCGKTTKNRYLVEGRCPNCTGTASRVDGQRDYGTNGGVRCDTNSGPCACGAWH